VAEQLGWLAPDHCIVPGASGALFTKIYKGLKDMADVGLIEPIHTKMHIAQAEGCSPIVEAYDQGSFQVQPVRPNTIAKSLAIGNPADGPYALRVIASSDGSAVVAMEDEIVGGIQLLAETEGIFTETAGGVVIAGLQRLISKGLIKGDELTVAYITGNGLKTQEAVEGLVQTIQISPSYDAFTEAMARR
jgi:threonine synthase